MNRKIVVTGILAMLLTPLFAQSDDSAINAGDPSLLLFLIGGCGLAGITLLWAVIRIKSVITMASPKRWQADAVPKNFFDDLTAEEIDLLLQRRGSPSAGNNPLLAKASPVILTLLLSNIAHAGTASPPGSSLLEQPGIIITLLLILIPLFLIIILIVVKANKLVSRFQYEHKSKRGEALADQLQYVNGEEIEAALLKRKASLNYSLTHNELSGTKKPEDPKGLLRPVDAATEAYLVAQKRKSDVRPPVDPKLARLVLWFLATATFWLLFGTSVGEYLGIKFVAPDVDQISWLSFGRLRPVHTNAVFWGWSSLAMIGLAYYVVPTVSNVPLFSLRKGWITLWLINAAVILGSICLMAGINNAGGEYREYIWPVMGLFGLGLLITLQNFIKTIAERKTREIYFSNWYIVAAIMFTLVITIIAYWPGWQNGLGETIIQGYYMHQGVGMWFMLFSLGLVYYFLPQQLNKPIYSYSLGVLAFWAQILFYTLIGTHHFVFSAIPWWLQTVAIVGSVGMVIPVVAGTTNFFMTFKGSWSKVANSYTLPFYLVGIVFYFTGSLQGTAEAFRFTNLLWHFTDFTVAHSHLTMYGIITFLLWGSIYAIVPRLTRNEPSQLLTGAHFWLAFLGMMLYTVPLMVGGTLKGLTWMEGKPFIDSVVLMAPYWLWRAIGGTLMWISHLVFAWNFYGMIAGSRSVSVKEIAFLKLRERQAIQTEAV
jgi:cytochrome c oxidase cbb3-type subunit 1